MRLSELATQEIKTFKQSVQISDGITFDHYDVIKRINLYANDEFYECDEEDAIFWNLGRHRVVHFGKKLDLDTKNFEGVAEGDNTSYQAWALNIKYRQWARESGFSLILDDIAEGLAAYGSSVVKLIKKEGGGYNIKECDLSRLYFDTTAESIEGKTKYEEHQLTEYELYEMDGIWDNIDKAIEQAEIVERTGDGNTVKRFKIYERTGFYREGKDNKWDKDKKQKFMRYVFCGSGDKEVILYRQELKKEDDPYYDFHIGKYMGRWLRIGVYERLFPLQEQTNKFVNQDDQAAQIANLLLFLSNDPTLVGRNVLKEAVTGEIIDAAQLRQLDISNRAFGEFVRKMQMYEQKADELCMTADVMQGKLPSDMPVRGQILAMNTINSAFKSARDRYGYKFCKLLVDKILPAEVKDWNRQDVLEISTSEADVRMYDFVAVKLKMNAFIAREWAKGKNPSPVEKEMEMQNIIKELETHGRKIPGMKDFFNFKYGFKWNPTGETENKEQKNDAYFNALQMFQSNPAIINIPLFREYLEYNGIQTFRLTSGEIQEVSQTQGAMPEPKGNRDKLLSEVQNVG
jgi:hypothetical protein